MRNALLSARAVLLILVLASTQLVNAQDTIKKVIVRKPAVTKTNTTVIMPHAVKRAAIDPKTGKPFIPINPKTGRPYSKYGYGAYAKTGYNAKAAHTADSLKKANALKAATPAAAPPVVAAPVAAVPVAPVDKSLNGQYQYLLTKVYGYQQPYVAALWKNVRDTLNTNKRKLADAQANAAEQATLISTMKADAAAKEESAAKADQINLMGMSLSKGLYSGIMWGLVAILALALVIIVVTTSSLRREATYRAGLYNDLEEELKNHKLKANEKEKKLARELQTERNKVDELMGRG